MGAKARSAEAMRAESRLSLGDTTLAAPFSGVVVARLIERGGTVGPNTPAFTIADLSRVKVGFYVPDTALVNLRTGSPVRVTVEALGGKAFDGAVQSLAPRAEAATRGFRVEALVANPLAELRAGMVAAVAPARPAVQPKVAVPMSALLREGTAEFAVLVFENGAVCRRRVTLGRAQGSLVAVESGLRVGERLVREGLATLAEGDAVQVIE
ncbi:MAG TPA: hypothetical protein DEH78_08240 [Solibacterales bacterium]|nr:hypothetical protein [Bryobacterales bacterium]